MLKEGKIGVFEAVSIATIMISSKVLFSSARAVVELAGTAAWYLTIISSGTALAGFIMIFLLLKRFPGRELVSVFETVLGRVAGSLVSLMIAFFFVVNASLFTREFVEAVKIYQYPMSPPSFMMLFFILAVMTVLQLGFEVITRTASLFAWPILLGLIFIFVFAMPLYSVSNLFPIFGHGLGKTVTNGLMRSSVYGDVLALAVVVNSLQGIGHFKKAGITAVILSGLVISSSFLFYHLAFPYYIALENTIPLLAITREIEYGRFFQRFEAIFLFTWSISAILAAGINLYMALSIYCKVFRIDDHRVLVFPLGIILFTVAILPPDISSIAFTYVQWIRQSGWMVYFGFPLLALLVAVARGKKGGPAGA